MQAVYDKMKAVVGAKGVVAPEDAAPFLTEWREKFTGRPALILQPGTTVEVSQILMLANEAGVGVVPQSGNTGLVGGQMPSMGGDEVLINLSRMNRILSLDPVNDTMTVETGAILQKVQEAAAEAGRLFPLSLASEGSAEIGGLLSTNAGGLNVLKYGTARAQVLGLEVVLADGRIWDGRRGLRKDNTGYDLKDLFIGAEGTLGIITGAVLKLFPRPVAKATALVALQNLDAAPALLALVREETGDAVSAFELMPKIGFQFLKTHAGLASPLETETEWSVLFDLEAMTDGKALAETMDALLEKALARGLIVDGAVAQSLSQAESFWALRERLSEIQKHEGGSIKHDIAVQISDIPSFVARAVTAVEAACPDIRPFIFGHVGDGNLHFNLSQPKAMDKTDYLARWQELSGIVHSLVAEMNGSISAEHGIGQLKREDLRRVKSAVELDMMRAIKAAFDPKGIMNPGKVL